MMTGIKKLLSLLYGLWCKIRSWSFWHLSFFLPLLFSFALMFAFIGVTHVRNQAIRTFKAELVEIQNYLSEFNIDIAYDNISFNAMFTAPLIEIENFKIYNLRQKHLWSATFGSITAQTGFFSTGKLRLKSENGLEFVYDGKTYPITAEIKANISADSDDKFKKLSLNIEQMNIKDFAKISKASFKINRLAMLDHSAVIEPSLESKLEIRDVKLNGLLQYPLTSEIKRIYLENTVMGQIELGEYFYPSAGNWLHNGGYIDTNTLLINWEPLTLAGRGTVKFNENLQPRINLTTSSKAMLNLLDDLQKNQFLNRKEAFVANILLNAKAFKLREDDKYLTLSTPISYQDGKLAIENITVKTFKP